MKIHSVHETQETDYANLNQAMPPQTLNLMRTIPLIDTTIRSYVFLKVRKNRGSN